MEERAAADEVDGACQDQFGGGELASVRASATTLEGGPVSILAKIASRWPLNDWSESRRSPAT